MDAGMQELVRVAQSGVWTSYGEFNEAIAEGAGVRKFDFNNDGERNAIGTLLADVVKADPLHPQFMISAVVKLAARDAGPGEGFYTLAEHLEHLDHLKPGASSDEKYGVWSQHVGMAFDHYRRRPRPRPRTQESSGSP
ncbi:hypothetical protein [Arthrobacter sp. MDT1-65]